MADWTTIPDATLGEGKPIRGVDLRAIRDLPAALARGAPNAPSVTPWAMARAPVAAGNSIRHSDPVRMFKTTISNRQSDEGINLTGAHSVAYAVCLMNSGSVRARWTQCRNGGSGQIEGVIGRVRAGTYTALSGTITNTNTSNREDKTYDVTGLLPGDTIVWLIRPQNGGTEVQMYNFGLSTSGGLLHPMPAFFTFATEPT